MSLTRSHPMLGRSIALLAVCASLAACGGSGSGSSSSSTGGGAGADDDSGRVRLTQCLRENGVDVPDSAGQGAPRDIDADELQAALDGPCKALQSQAGGTLSDDDRQELQDRFQKYAQCMRDNGVDVPDLGSGGGPPTGGGQIDQDDPDVKAANEKCQGELPQNRPGGGE